jgi:hypothetical protein
MTGEDMAKQEFEWIRMFISESFYQGMNTGPKEHRQTVTVIVENFACLNGEKAARGLANQMAEFLAANASLPEKKLIKELWALGAPDMPSYASLKEILQEIAIAARNIESKWTDFEARTTLAARKVMEEEREIRRKVGIEGHWLYDSPTLN